MDLSNEIDYIPCRALPRKITGMDMQGFRTCLIEFLKAAARNPSKESYIWKNYKITLKGFDSLFLKKFGLKGPPRFFISIATSNGKSTSIKSERNAWAAEEVIRELKKIIPDFILGGTQTYYYGDGENFIFHMPESRQPFESYYTENQSDGYSPKTTKQRKAEKQHAEEIKSNSRRFTENRRSANRRPMDNQSESYEKGTHADGHELQTRKIIKPEYEILGISEDAGPDEIKAQYRKLALKYHPDHNPGDIVAEEKFKNITIAYEKLRRKKTGIDISV